MALKHVRVHPGYDPNFPHTWIIQVNGHQAHPFYKLARTACRAPKKTFSDTQKLFYKPLHENDVRWNFEKYLIDHNGWIVRHYRETVKPAEMSKDIVKLLRQRLADIGNDAASWK